VSSDPGHIALFLSGLGGGGAQRRVVALAHAFVDKGHRVDLVVASSDGPLRAELSPAVRLVPLDSRLAGLPGVVNRRGPRVLASTPALARYLRRERPDVVLSTSNPANLACLWARAWPGVSTPVVVSVNAQLTAGLQGAWGPALRTVVRASYANADAIVANSQAVAVDLARSTRARPEKITVIHNFLDLGEIRERAREPLEHPWVAPGGPPLVLAVGKLKPQKDFPTLLRAFARVRAARPARLVILGEGDDRDAIEELARELGVATDTALPGFVSNPFAWMARAAVFAHPSIWDGFSNVLSEAVACGCPAVSTDCPGGASEILDHGAIGPLVPVGDDRAMAEAILSLLDAPPDPELLCSGAARFAVEAAVERTLEVLSGAVGQA
jgi:glycosyltransferase involved in cell wall biosynthesis